MNRLKMLMDQLSTAQTEIDTMKENWKEIDGKERKPTKEEYQAIKEKLEEIKLLKENIEVEKELIKNQASISTGENSASHIRVMGPAAEQEPYALGKYLQDIVVSARSIQSGGSALPRVSNYQKSVVVKAAATGSSESIPSDGGFLVGEDFTSGIVKRAYDNNQVISRCTRRTISGNSNSVKINGNDETSRANGSRHGGLRSYWVSEAGDLTGSKPKFRKMELELKKHAILYYATDEVLSDALLLEQEVNDAVSDELAFVTQDAIINGSGAGQPQGVLNSPALVSQAAETGQASATIVYENVLKMHTRKWGPISNYVWLVNQEIFPQLALMNVAVGTGGAPVYLPSGGASGAPYQTLLTRPIIEIEQASALGTVGDIILADLSQYMVIEKGGVQSAMSIHVEFTNDEVVFRWITRVDGQSMWSSALTPYKGSATRSPFVALATRS